MCTDQASLTQPPNHNIILEQVIVARKVDIVDRSGSNVGEQLTEQRGATGCQMLEPIAVHDRLQIAGRPEKLEARLFQPLAAMLLCKRQRSRRRASADVVAKLVLADELQPV